MNRVSAALAAACVLLAGCQATAPAEPATYPACTEEKIDSLAAIVSRIAGQCFFGTQLEAVEERNRRLREDPSLPPSESD